jgi:8-amino-7-oxononanoate synthase
MTDDREWRTENGGWSPVSRLLSPDPALCFEEELRSRLHKIDELGLLRKLYPAAKAGGRFIRSGDKICLNLASNDYLGLASDYDLVQSFYRQKEAGNLLESFGPGAAASRLMTGNHPVYQMLEKRLSALYGQKTVLVFNSGYHLNVGVLPALTGKNDLILADRLCHASLIDGMRLSPATFIRFPHCDYEKLEQLLAQKRHNFHQVFIVTESVFSMDGDVADLGILAELKKQYQAVLYVDDAHGVGVYGRTGLGVAEEQAVLEDVDLLVGTFGKAWGGQGAFLISAPVVRQYLVNTARSFIFTTGLPPVSLSWLIFVAGLLAGMEEKRKNLRELAKWLRLELQNCGLETKAKKHSSSNIIPVMIGDADKALGVADSLRDRGFWVNAVRPPTVPPKTARLRISLTASMGREDLAPLPELISSLVL